MTAIPWPDDEAKTMRHNALHQFKNHDHDACERDDLVLDNCCACALLGRNELTMDEGGGPNVSGWGRLYVEAGKPIYKRWQQAFKRECVSNIAQYTLALQRSIKTFGYPKFIPLSQEYPVPLGRG